MITWYTVESDGYVNLFRSITFAKGHLLLSFIVSKAVMDLFQTKDPWALRLPSFLCGVMCIPAAFMLGREIWSVGLGLLLAVLAAVAPNMVDLSQQQARMYTPC